MDHEALLPARDVVWTPIWDPDRVGWGIELLRLSGARRVSSDAIAFDEGGRPFRIAYAIEWDDGWNVRRVHIQCVQDEERSLVLEADGRGNWLGAERAPMPQLDGCIDVDIWPTPFTNTFPIRRLGDRLADRTEVSVAYVRAPELELTAQRQAYTRVDERRVLFELVDSDFRAELHVDADGIVVDYAGLFRRLL